MSYLFEMFVDPFCESFLLYGISFVYCSAAASAGLPATAAAAIQETDGRKKTSS